MTAVAEGAKATSGTIRILVIDDNPDDRALVRRALLHRLASLEVLEVADQRGFDRVLEQGDFELVVTDYQLRWSNGLQVLHQVRARYPTRPVVMFTATGSEEIAVAAMKAGLDDYVLKSSRHLVHLVLAVQTCLDRQREGAAAHEAEQRYRRLFDQVPLGLYRSSLDGELLDANPTLVALLGYRDRETLLAQPAARLREVPEEYRAWQDALLADGGVHRFESRFRTHDQRLIWMEENARIVTGDDGAPLHCEGSLEDITERRQAEETLRSLKKAVDTLPIGVTITDLQGQIVYTNSAEALLHGYRLDELVGSAARIMVPPYYWRPLEPHQLAALRPWVRERVNLRKDGTTFPAQLVSDVIRAGNGDPIGMVTTCEDITERKRAEDRLWRSAFHDPLTDLPNRSLFMDRLGKSVERIRRRREDLFAVLFLDLDRFKLVNDSLGHSVGDQLLIEVARRLGACVRPTDTVSRLGGDEFAILAEGIRDVADAVQIAQRTEKAFAEPIAVRGAELFATASIGIAIGKPEYETPEEVLRDADTALYRAKAAGKARHEIFDTAMHARAQGLLQLEGDLRRALDRGEFLLHYQPIISLASGKLRGAEALLRWQHPQRGLLQPADFIPLAEETGLIGMLGQWVLRAACTKARVWQDAGRVGLRVAVNLSARQFRQRDLPEMIVDTLDTVGLDPHLLELELTESVVMEDADASSRALRALKERGPQISIDDFGTGYSSLSYLKRFPVDTLKIDRSFVSNVTTDPDDAAIATSVIALAHSLRLQVVAEGVETEDQLAFLRSRGCDAVQGYLLGKPLPELVA